MGKITEALKRVGDKRIQMVQKKPDLRHVVKRIEDSDIEGHIVAYHSPASTVGEQYKILRTNIQSLHTTKGYKTFAVTSAINGEGKTVSSVNLAVMMSQDLNNKSVLLVDADMRRGKVAKYLGINKYPGLSEVLAGSVEPDAVMMNPDIDNMAVIPCGRTPQNPAELIGAKRMKTVLEYFKSRFDYVIIDCPPVMPVTDPCIIGSICDAAVMVVQAGRTQRDTVMEAERRLTESHVNLAGFILTNVEYHLPQYLYRYMNKYDGEYYALKEGVGG